MIAEIMVHALLVSGVLTLAGLLVESLMRGRGYPRRWGWMGTITGSAAITVGLLLAPPALAPDSDPVREGEYTAFFGTVTVWENPNIEPASRDAFALTFALAFQVVKGLNLGRDVLASLTSGIAGTLNRIPQGERVLALLWAIVSLLTLCILAISARRLRQRIDRLPVESVDGRKFAVAASLGPAVVGFWHPQIVLPRWLLTTPVESLALILTHEEEHLRARDTLLLAAGLGAIIVAPWNPFVWMQLRRLRLAIEMDCDARVIRHGVPPTRYASVLVEVGGRAGSLPFGATALSEPPHFLERRMKTILRPFRKISLLRTISIGGTACFLIAFALTTPPPAAWVVSLGAAVPTTDIEESGDDQAVGESSLSPIAVESDTLDSTPDAAVNRALTSVCLRGPNGETECTEVSRDDSHVVCAVEGDGSWGCREVAGSRDAQRACMVVPGNMYLCADTAIFEWISGGGEPGAEDQEPLVYSVLEGAGNTSAPQGATPQDISATPTFFPVETFPSVGNIPAVMAAIQTEYPVELRAAGIGGQVIMHMYIDAVGAVQNCTIQTGSGSAALDNAALRVCPVFSFVPARNFGEAVPVWIQIPITFTSR